MEILKSTIQQTVFTHHVFIEHNDSLLKYEVDVTLSGTSQFINIYKRHDARLTTSEKNKIRSFIEKQFRIT